MQEQTSKKGSKMRQTLVKMGVRAMSKVDAPKMGFDKGFQKYYNYYTIQGRYGAFAACIGLIYGVVKICTWKYNRPYVQEQKREAQAKRDLFERCERAWEANGKKFD